MVSRDATLHALRSRAAADPPFAIAWLLPGHQAEREDPNLTWIAASNTRNGGLFVNGEAVLSIVMIQ